MHVRVARPDDFPRFVALIRELAGYEKLPGPTPEEEARLREDAFGPSPRFSVHMGEVDGRVEGYAIVFETYSTFRAAPILYLEDLYVTPAARRRGLATHLMRHLASDAIRRGCVRMGWVVLDWNEPAQRFYEGLGAQRAAGWWPYALERDAMERLVGPPLDDRDAS